VETIKPTMSERAWGASIATSAPTLVLILSRIYEYHEHHSVVRWGYLLAHLRLWFIVFVPIMALFGATAAANGFAERRARRG
jgi:hypothetical protein